MFRSFPCDRHPLGMRLSFSPYQLSASRSGALLRYEENGLVGYGDIHPLQEWGDPPLTWHLSHPDSLLRQRALHFAKIDAEARSKGINLLKGKIIPNSHRLITDLSDFDSKGFSCMKIKVGRNPQREIRRLHEEIPFFEKNRLLLRLDFNLLLSHEEFHAYMKELKLLHSFIEFIEDPFPFDSLAWEEEGAYWRCQFAMDFESEKGLGQPKAAPLLILKPARQSEIPFLKASGQKVIVTSSLDHPLAQVQAAYVAVNFPSQISGLLSHKAYPLTVISQEIEGEGSEFRIPSGTGFGFDQHLEGMKWEVLHA